MIDGLICPGGPQSPLLTQLPSLQPNVSGFMHRTSMVKESWESP